MRLTPSNPNNFGTSKLNSRNKVPNRGNLKLITFKLKHIKVSYRTMFWIFYEEEDMFTSYKMIKLS